MTEWVRLGQTVNQTYYLNVLATPWERIRKKQPELWKNKLSISHQDKAPADNVPTVKHYWATRGTPVLEHALYSSDLAPCDFPLFPKIKSVVRRQIQICPIFIICGKLNLKIDIVAKTIVLDRIVWFLAYDMLEGSALSGCWENYRTLKYSNFLKEE